MSTAFEYLVVHIQSAHVTYVNGAWQGKEDLNSVEFSQAINSCPWVWDYLNEFGGEGWELITAYATSLEQAGQQTVYLKREIQG